MCARVSDSILYACCVPVQSMMSCKSSVHIFRECSQNPSGSQSNIQQSGSSLLPPTSFPVLGRADILRASLSNFQRHTSQALRQRIPSMARSQDPRWSRHPRLRLLPLPVDILQHPMIQPSVEPHALQTYTSNLERTSRVKLRDFVEILRGGVFATDEGFFGYVLDCLGTVWISLSSEVGM